jgi:C4-dicarboxylate-specific signal transduction histidine kinase
VRAVDLCRARSAPETALTLTQKLVLGFLFALVLQVAQMLISSYFTAEMQEASEQVAHALTASMAVQSGLDAGREVQTRARHDAASPEARSDPAIYRVFVEELRTQAATLARACDPTQHAPVALVEQRLAPLVHCLGELERAARGKDPEAHADAASFLDDAMQGLTEALLQTQIHVRGLAHQGVERERAVHHRPMQAGLVVTLGGVVLMALFVAWFSRQLVIPIERAWAELERRVAERTNELAATVTQLEAQIVERERAEARTRELHEQLIATSRRAGMAELANGVLHNVGNVLNSVNVSANVLLDRLRKSKADGLQKAVDLIKAHEADLGAFLTASTQGKKLPHYLETLASHLVQDRDLLVRETVDLSQRIDHMKEIVSRQQSYARVSGTTSREQLAKIVDDVLAMHASSFQKHDIRIVRRIDYEGEGDIDRSRVMQILTNLVNNAKHALIDRDHGGAVLEIGVTKHGDNRVRLAVADNGIGIPAENLTRIFAHGFTTKRDGHGFGLHHSANAATEMGGRLWGESAGRGQGATFVLELPLQSPAPALAITAAAQ